MSNKMATGMVLGAALTLAIVIVVWYILQRQEEDKLAALHSSEKAPTTIIHFVSNISPAIEPKGQAIALPISSYQESVQSILEFKNFIENEDGYKLLYNADGSLKDEKALQLLFKPFLKDKVSDGNSEVNNGRGPVDFKLSIGGDKTLIEFKLGSNLKKSFLKQTSVYSKANSDALCLTVVLITSETDERKVNKILVDVDRADDKTVFTIDGRKDKPSASVA